MIKILTRGIIVRNGDTQDLSHDGTDLRVRSQAWVSRRWHLRHIVVTSICFSMTIMDMERQGMEGSITRRSRLRKTLYISEVDKAIELKITNHSSAWSVMVCIYTLCASSHRMA
jgi:hypothetical protein